MNVTDLIVNVAILFIMMLPGLILKKCKFCPDGFGKGISNLVLYIAQPALILYAYLSCESKISDIWFGCLMTFVLSVVAHAIFSVVALLMYKKVNDGHRRMLRFATIFGNAAFMGIPLIQSILSPEAAIYASIYNITFNLFLWTLGVHLCTRKAGEDMDGDGDSDLRDEYLSAVHHTKKEVSILKVLLHPVTIASVLGLVLLALGVNVKLMNDCGLTVITSSLDKLRGLVAPLSMVVIGLRLTDIDYKNILRDINLYKFLVQRHLVLPALVIGFMFLLKLMGASLDNTTIMVTTILAATPAASSATMFAEKYDCDAGYVSSLVVVSTILSIATMPLLILLAGLI